jgi:hypothetical protein
MRKIFRPPISDPEGSNQFKRYHINFDSLNESLKNKENQQIVGKDWVSYLNIMGNALRIIKYMYPLATTVLLSKDKIREATRVELQDLIYRSSVNDANYDFSGDVEVGALFF